MHQLYVKCGYNVFLFNEFISIPFLNKKKLIRTWIHLPGGRISSFGITLQREAEPVTKHSQATDEVVGKTAGWQLEFVTAGDGGRVWSPT